MRSVTTSSSNELIEKLFFAIHRDSVSTGEFDFQLAADLVDNFVERHGEAAQLDEQTRQQALEHLNKAIDKGHEPAKRFLPILLCMSPGDMAVRGHEILVETSIIKNKDHSLKSSNYFLGNCILNAKKFNYDATKINLREILKKETVDVKKIVFKFLSNQDFLTLMKQYEKKPKWLVTSLLRAAGDYAEEAYLAQKKEEARNAEEKKLQKTKSKKPKAKPIKQPHVEDHRVITDVLAMIHERVYGEGIIFKWILQEKTAEIAKLKNVGCTQQYWESIQKGFSGDSGVEFLTQLESFNLYAVLFPAVFPLSPERRQKNKTWLVKYLDEMGQSATRDENLAILLLVQKELPNQWTRLVLEKIHAAYQVPVPCDDAFEKSLRALDVKKCDYFTKQAEAEQSPTLVMRH